MTPRETIALPGSGFPDRASQRGHRSLPSAVVRVWQRPHEGEPGGAAPGWAFTGGVPACGRIPL